MNSSTHGKGAEGSTGQCRQREPAGLVRPPQAEGSIVSNLSA